MRIPYVILVILLLLNVFAWAAASYLNDSYLKVSFLDVGQGDAIFIETPQRCQILIDGGPSSAILKNLGEQMPFWDRTVDLVVLTHPDHDHIAGLLEVLKRYDVDNVLWTGILTDTPESEEWQKLIKEEGANIYIARSGLQMKAGPVSVAILYPFDNLENKKVSDVNDTSVVAKLVFGETSFLFTGDIDQSVERVLAKEGIDIDSDILKVAHHGSKTSSCKDFISLVSPDAAVISCGKENPYGHPHQETLDALEGAAILRTDFLGDIKLITDGRIIGILD